MTGSLLGLAAYVVSALFTGHPSVRQFQFCAAHGALGGFFCHNIPHFYPFLDLSMPQAFGFIIADLRLFANGVLFLFQVVFPFSLIGVPVTIRDIFSGNSARCFLMQFARKSRDLTRDGRCTILRIRTLIGKMF